MALGAIQAIKGRGLNVKDFVVVGIDGVPDAINAVKAGEMFEDFWRTPRDRPRRRMSLSRAKIGEIHQPRAAVWKQWKKEMPWNGWNQGRFYSREWSSPERTPDDLLNTKRN